MPHAHRGLSLALALAALTVGGCLDRGGLDPLPDAGGSGGDTGTGGTGSGGKTGGTGGADTATGGAMASGGTGAVGSGGVGGTGGTGATGSGGAVTGGRMGTGGASPTGGVMGGTGGSKGTGGNQGTGGKTMCGAVCDIFCPYGNVLDSNGCATCKCNPMPMCPQIKCASDCPFGFATDAKGCQTCTCNPDPKTCTIDQCGPMPAVGAIICPAGTTAALSETSGAAADIAAPVAPPYSCVRDASTGKCVWQPQNCGLCPIRTCPMCATGYEIGADGCTTCTCKPGSTSACAYTTAASCATDQACRWLQPGCTEPSLAAAGCFPLTSIGCTTDAACGTGRQCLKRFVNPCASPSGSGTTACTACALLQGICQ